MDILGLGRSQQRSKTATEEHESPASQDRKAEPQKPPQRMNLRERFEWVLRMALLVFILASASFLSAITAIRFAIHGREVVMPHLVGLNHAEAQRQLAAAGIRVAKVTVVLAPEWPHDTVTDQMPPQGSRVAAGSGVELQVAE